MFPPSARSPRRPQLRDIIQTPLGMVVTVLGVKYDGPFPDARDTVRQGPDSESLYFQMGPRAANHHGRARANLLPAFMPLCRGACGSSTPAARRCRWTRAPAEGPSPPRATSGEPLWGGWMSAPPPALAARVVGCDLSSQDEAGPLREAL